MTNRGVRSERENLIHNESSVVEPLSETAVLISHWTNTYAAHAEDGSGALATSTSSFHDAEEPDSPTSCSNFVWDLLMTKGKPDNDDETPVIYVQSYFIDHLRHLHGHLQRPLRFSLDWHDWEKDIKLV